jgi:hypothetical protein
METVVDSRELILEDEERKTRARRKRASRSGPTFVEIVVPEEEVLEQIQYAERLGMTPISVKKRGPITRIMFCVPEHLSLSP